MDATDKHKRRGRLPHGMARTVTLGLVILVCGMVLGSGLTLAFLRNRIHTILETPEKLPERITRRLDWMLDLSPEQREGVLAIVERRQDRMQELRSRIWPELRQLNRETREAIAALLEPEQRERWEERYRVIQRIWAPFPPDTDTTDAPEKGG